jgi:hypothetical protein
VRHASGVAAWRKRNPDYAPENRLRAKVVKARLRRADQPQGAGRADQPHQTLGRGTDQCLCNRGFNLLVICTERRRAVITAFLALAIIIILRLVRDAWTTHRWDTRPARRP